MPEHSPSNDPLDALLTRMPVQARPDFAARTLARIHSQDEHAGELVDRLLRARPVEAHASFTRRTVARARGRSFSGIFGIPTAAAAAVALSFAALWVRAPDSGGQAIDAAAAPHRYSAIGEANAMDELMALVEGLRDAAPLLDADASEALAAFTSWGR